MEAVYDFSVGEGDDGLGPAVFEDGAFEEFHLWGGDAVGVVVVGVEGGGVYPFDVAEVLVSGIH